MAHFEAVLFDKESQSQAQFHKVLAYPARIAIILFIT